MKKRFQKLAAGLALLAAAGIAAAYIGLPHFLKPRIEKRLEQFLGAQVAIESLSVGIFTGARMERLSIRPPGGEKRSKAPVSLSDVGVDHCLTDLISGKYRVTRVHIRSFSALVDQKVLDWALGLRIHPKPPLQFPRIELAEGRLRFDLPVLAREVPISDLRFSAWQSDAKRVSAMLGFASNGNTVQLQCGIVPGNGFIESDVHIAGFDLSALPEIDTDVFPFDPAKLDLEGSLTGSFSAHLPSRLNEQTGFSGQVSLNGLAGKYAGLPFCFENGTANVSLSNHSLTFRNGAVNVAGGSIEVPAAGMTFGKNGIDRCWLRADVRDFDMAELNRPALLKRLPESYRPEIKSGTMSAGLRARWSSKTGLEYGGDVMVHDIAGALAGELPAFRGLNAELSFDSSGEVQIRQAWARLFGGRAEAAGSFVLAGKKVRRPHLEFQFTDIRQKAGLVDLLPKSVRKAIALTGVSGARAGGRIWLNADDIEVDVTVGARSASLPDLPFTLTDMVTDIKWASGTSQVAFTGFSASMKGSPVEGGGVLKFKNDFVADFRLMGRYLPLNNALFKWLRIDMNQWQVGGSYDIELRASNWRPRETLSASLAGLRAQVDLRDAYAARPDFGTVARNCYGHATLDAEGFQLTNFRGDLFGVGLQGSGAVPIKGSDLKPRVQFESETVSLGPALYDRLPLDTGSLRALELAGQCKLQAELQGFAGDKNPLSGSVSAVVYQLELAPRETPISANGFIRVNIDGKNWQDLRMDGSVNFNEFAVGALDGDRLTGDFVYRRPHLIFEELAIGAYGGKIASEDTVINLVEKTWHSSYEIAHVDFESLMSAFGVKGKEAPSGVLRSDMTIGAQGLNRETLWGGGTVKVDRGRLYSFPILVSVLSVLDLQLPSQSPVTDAYAVLGLGQGKLQVKDLIFSGGSLPVHMEGEVDLDAGVPFKQQHINFLVTVAKSEGWLDQLPVINWIKHYTVDLLRRLVFQSRVKGTFADYEIQTLSSPVTTPIKKMLVLLKKITPSPPGQD